MKTPTIDCIWKGMTMLLELWPLGAEPSFRAATIVLYAFGTSLLALVDGFWSAILRKVAYSSLLFCLTFED